MDQRFKFYLHIEIIYHYVKVNVDQAAVLLKILYSCVNYTCLKLILNMKNIQFNSRFELYMIK